jgi:hypothetical protein
MNRRGFLGLLVGGLATAAAVRTFPFRVFSFPSEIKPGLATSAAVRTFPFRVFSFPSEIEPVRFHLPDPLTAEQMGMLQLEFFRDRIPDLTCDLTINRFGDLYDTTGPYMGIRRDRPGFHPEMSDDVLFVVTGVQGKVITYESLGRGSGIMPSSRRARSTSRS